MKSQSELEMLGRCVRLCTLNYTDMIGEESLEGGLKVCESSEGVAALSFK